MVSIFLSHNSEDKDFVRELHNFLKENGINSWIDEAEIKIGESLIEKISDGIKKADYVAIVLSPNSMNSPWVKKELEMAITQEINGQKNKVLPILIENCEIPEYIKPKKYGDFRTSTKAIRAMQELLLILKGKEEPKKISKILTKKEQEIKLQNKKDISKFKEIYDIAIAAKYAGGMGLPQSQAMALARFFETKNEEIFEKFKEIYDIAIAAKYAGGMGLSEEEAVNFALERIK